MIEQKIGRLEKGQQNCTSKVEQVVEVETKEKKLEEALKLVDDAFKCLEGDVQGTQKALEKVDNSLRRINLRQRSLKEGAKSNNLKEFLVILLVACLVSDSEIEVKLTFSVG